MYIVKVTEIHPDAFLPLMSNMYFQNASADMSLIRQKNASGCISVTLTKYIRCDVTDL